MQTQKKVNQRQEQIKARLESVKSVKELKKIMKSSHDQNKKLIGQVKELKDRVDLLMNKRGSEQTKIQPADKNQKKIDSQIEEIRKQLKIKYKKMKELKDEINRHSSLRVEETQFTKTQYANNIADLDKSIKLVKKQVQDLKDINQKLEKTIESNSKEENLNQPRVIELENENKDLRIKIGQIRKQQKKKQYQSIKVQTKLITSNEKMKELEGRRSMSSLKNIRNLSKNEILSEEELFGLRKQVEGLKKQFQKVEETLKNEDIENRKKRSSLFNNNKELIKKLRELENNKCKLEQQNNLWKRKWADICRAVKLHSKKVKKVSIQIQQVEYFDPTPLRRDYAGIFTKNKFDDRQILLDDKKTKITGMMIYEIEKGIAAIQAIYDNGKRTYLSIPHHFIQRCRVTKVECSQNDFFKLFKVKYNMIDNRITKLEIRSNKNIKYHYGEKKPWTQLVEGDTIYGFDIGIKEYPVSIFGSYNHQKGYWLLEGFGVQINDLQ